MSEPENFLERWSRRKQQASVEPGQAPAANAEKDEASAAAPATPVEPGEPKPAAFDIAELPSIESIGADTDVRGFLQPGVPPELTRAALRRAWSSDPAIRDFVGLVENGWDFNDPNAMHGFGPITPEEVARLLTQSVTLTEPPPAPEPAQVAAIDDKSADESAPPVGETAAASAVAPAPARSARSEEPAAAQHGDDDDAAPQKNSDV
jgi:Protein of unknown function (DUF3306)